MSCDLYLTCQDHDPPLLSYWEVGHWRDLDFIRGLIARRDEFVAANKLEAEYSDSRVTYSVQFLVQHPRCNIGIVDEYGEPYPVIPDETKEASAP